MVSWERINGGVHLFFSRFSLYISLAFCFLFFLLPSWCLLTQLNAEEYVTLDDFEEDLKLMASEAKEVRDRIKGHLAHAEGRARAFCLAEGVLPDDGETTAAAAAAAGAGGAAGTATANAASGSMFAGGGGGGGGVRSDAGRRALMDVDRVTAQLGRAAAGVDMACFLRDAALSFLQE